MTGAIAIASFKDWGNDKVKKMSNIIVQIVQQSSKIEFFIEMKVNTFKCFNKVITDYEEGDMLTQYMIGRSEIEQLKKFLKLFEYSWI